MSNHLAIATVTAALRKHMENAVTAELTDLSVGVTFGRPPETRKDQSDPNINVFLYRVTPNASRANADLPTRSPSGQPVARPAAALDLHYLMSFSGDESRLEPQRILGTVVRTLEAKPIVTHALIEAVLADPEFSYLSESDLGQAIESIRLTRQSLSLEELSQLWSMLTQTPYLLSVAYQASCVIVDAAETPGAAVPVAERRIFLRSSVDLGHSISPAELPGLQLWLKSDAGLTHDAAGISRWEDQSGLEHHAAQAEAQQRPRLVAHGLNNKPVVRFDGQDDCLAIEGWEYAASGAIDAITVCGIVRSESPEQPQIVISFDASQYWQLALRTGGGPQLGWDTTDETGTTDALLSEQTLADGRWHLVCVIFSATATPDKRVYVDGTRVSDEAAHAGNALGTGARRFGLIGSGSQADAFDGARGPEWYLRGELAEVVVWHHAVTDDERPQLESYFLKRYRQQWP